MSGGELFVMINGAAASACALAVIRSLRRGDANPGRLLLKAVFLASLLFFVYAYAARLFHMSFNDAFIGLARVAVPAAFLALAGYFYLD